MYTTKKMIGIIILVLFTIVISTSPGITQEKLGDTPFLLLKLDKVQLMIDGVKSKNNPTLNTELLYRFSDGKFGMEAELMSFGFVTNGFESKRGKTGNISIRFLPEHTKTTYNSKSNLITTEFEAEIHYPLIDKIMGFKEPGESKEIQDNFRSFTETISGVITCRLDRRPDIKDKKEQTLRVIMDMKMNIAEKAVGAFEYAVVSEFELEATIVWPLYFQKVINVQPVFVEYVPDTGCSLGGGVASTGGSWDIMKEYADDIWSRCCLHLNLLPPVYVADDDWRILSSGEADALRSSYDDPNAVEIFFTETFDPIGTWGGGATWGVWHCQYTDHHM